MRISTSSLAVVAAVAFAAPGWAAQHGGMAQDQDQMQQQQQPVPGQEGQQAAQPPAGEAAEDAEAQAAVAGVEGDAMVGLSKEEARDLLGLTVRTTAGNEIGTLRGLSLGRGEHPAFAVIEVGGDLEQILGVEQPTITVDAEKLTRAPATEELVLNMPMSELEVAPEFLQTFAESPRIDPEEAAQPAEAPAQE